MPRMLGGDRCSGATQQSKGDGECVISLWWSGQSPGLQSSIKLSVKALPRRWHLHKELEEAGSALCSFLGSCVPEQRLLLEVQLESDCGWSWVRGEWWGQEEGEGANVVGCPRPLQSIWLLSELGKSTGRFWAKGWHNLTDSSNVFTLAGVGGQGWGWDVKWGSSNDPGGHWTADACWWLRKVVMRSGQILDSYCWPNHLALLIDWMWGVKKEEWRMTPGFLAWASGNVVLLYRPKEGHGRRRCWIKNLEQGPEPAELRSLLGVQEDLSTRGTQ